VIVDSVYVNSHAGIARSGLRIWHVKTNLPEGETIKTWKDPGASVAVVVSVSEAWATVVVLKLTQPIAGLVAS